MGCKIRKEFEQLPGKWQEQMDVCASFCCYYFSQGQDKLDQRPSSEGIWKQDVKSDQTRVLFDRIKILWRELLSS